uniref:Uncharacterized protein n=1 Tax=Oryza nivara TaxID=4536 RepID=A0A0E0FPW2_ORYNI
MVPPMRTEDGSSQFLPGHAAFSGVPQVNMPMFPTGMNDQWHGAFTYNTTLHLRGMYQISINENAQSQGPSFFEMLGQGDWLFSQPPIMQPQTTGMYTADQMMGYAGSTQSYREPCVARVGGRQRHNTR